MVYFHFDFNDKTFFIFYFGVWHSWQNSVREYESHVPSNVSYTRHCSHKNAVLYLVLSVRCVQSVIAVLTRCTALTLSPAVELLI